MTGRGGTIKTSMRACSGEIRMQANEECNGSVKEIRAAGQERYYLSGFLFVKGWKNYEN